MLIGVIGVIGRSRTIKTIGQAIEVRDFISIDFKNNFQTAAARSNKHYLFLKITKI
jgi:hypothetical protein